MSVCIKKIKLLHQSVLSINPFLTLLPFIEDADEYIELLGDELSPLE
jgi:hypothetical protein